MRKTRGISWGWRLLTVVSSLVLVLMLGLLAEPFSIMSHAQSQGKVTANSAKIRKDASTDSEALGSATQGAEVTINHQVTGSDGKVWYQVFVDADTLGYIRSDLVTITDGTTPPTSTETTNNATNNDTGTNNTTTSNNTTTTNTNENMAEVTAVEPMSASVTGSQSVRVRSNASTGSQIVTMAQNGTQLTVTGQAEGTDGKVWYQVKFLSDGSEVTGFIRSDYVSLSGELVPKTEEPVTPPAEEPTEEPEKSVEQEVTKDWYTEYDDGKWYLVDNVTPGRYDIKNIFDTVEANQKVLEQAQDKAKSQRIWIVILVFLVIAMGGAVVYLIYKIKDMTDSAYFAEVERETIRRRTSERPANGGRVMHTVGAEKRPAQNGQRPAGAPAQGSQRPAQGSQRPAQGSQRPAQNGQRPAGASAQGSQRPVQNSQRPTGTRQAGAPAQGGQRPVQNMQPPIEENMPVQNTMQARTQQAAPRPRQSGNAQNSEWKSKNFMTDDDEFEFEFLNWDGDDE